MTRLATTTTTTLLLASLSLWLSHAAAPLVGAVKVSPEAASNAASPPSPPLAVCEADVPKIEDQASLDAFLDAGAELKFVYLIHRHGDRAPYTGWKEFGVGCGDLTPKGEEQMKDLGVQLSKYLRGHRFEVKSEDVALFSTDYPRAIKSYKMVQEGMGLTPSTKVSYIEQGMWSDSSNAKKCRNYLSSPKNGLGPLLSAQKEFKDSETSQKLKKTFAYGMPYPMLNLIDPHVARVCHGMSSPSELTTDEFNAWLAQGMCLHDYHLNALYRNTVNDTLKKVSKHYAKFWISTYLRSLLYYAREVHNMRPPFAKLFHYSGHETMIAPLLGALNANRIDWPPYRSNFLIEVWRAPVGVQPPWQPAAPATYRLPAQPQCQAYATPQEFEAAMGESGGQSARSAPSFSSRQQAPENLPTGADTTSSASTQGERTLIRILYNGKPLSSENECNFGTGCDFEAFERIVLASAISSAEKESMLKDPATLPEAVRSGGF